MTMTAATSLDAAMSGDVFLGIRGYEPQHVELGADLSADDRHRLRGLVGRELVASWAVWDVKDDEWFVDAPVVLDFGDRLEVAAFKTHLCLSWNAIDVSEPLDWYGTPFDLRWRRDPLPAVSALLDRPVTAVALLQHGNSVHGLALTAGNAYLELYNALDELGASNARGELAAVAV